MVMIKQKSERGSASIRHSKVNEIASQSSSGNSAMGGKPSDDAPIASPMSSIKSGEEFGKRKSKDVTEPALKSETTCKAVKVRPIGFDALAGSNESPL